MAQKDSISMQMVGEALQQCALGERERQQLLAAAGIAGPTHGRVSAQAYARLWRRLAQVTDDEFFGMDPRPLRSGSLAYLCRVAVSQPTLADALQVMLGFLSLMLGQTPAQLDVHQSLAQIVLGRDGGPPQRPFTYFTYWLIVQGLASWLVDRRLPVVAVELPCAAPEYLDDYRVLFSDNLRFERPQARLVLAAECLDWPVRRSLAEVPRFLARAPGNILVRYRDPDSLAQRIRGQLRRLDPAQWPEIETLARQLHMSASTLRRRLGEEGQAWQGLKDSVRKELATGWLADAALPVAEIAARLGFADSRAFYKAFRKWTGASPGHYRSLMLGGVQNAQAD
ncbi:AraC family transcriptional regulator [Pseudomonas sp. HR96]|uniref:AraC family transcriptional regulator n=1 Tax=Pseudomonas sp. HR96 TaxID=1027966 RepID=UPI002A76692A|nr:AraC family transcriptional regulator [Pseudomonas sp. HR96]WPP01525.1 AraC family transcriptional regulator [Pseudomonas sp. HR96]